MYKTVLFDLDGTLLNTIDDLADSANFVCASHGWPTYPVDRYRYFCGQRHPQTGGAVQPGIRAHAGKTRRHPEGIRCPVRRPHVRQDPRRIPVCRNCWPGCIPRGIRMAVYSNKADEFAGDVVGRYF